MTEDLGCQLHRKDKAWLDAFAGRGNVLEP